MAKKRVAEPVPEVKAPGCPTWLTGEARAEWRRQVKQLEAMGLIAEADRALLTAYCDAWAEFVALGKEQGRVVRKFGYERAIRNGLVSAKGKAVERLVKIASQFGFSPSARARLAPVDPGTLPAAPAKSRFFGRP